MLDIPIICEDDFLLIIDKPTGMVVNRAESVKEETLTDWAEKKLKIKNLKLKITKDDDFYQRYGIVHRLDKETSGLLIIAKTPQAFINLQSQFKERKVTKKYKTLVHGLIVPNSGEIKASVGRLPWNRERFGVLPGGREAVTSYKVIAYYKYFSLSSRAPRVPSGRGDLYKSIKIVSPATRDRNDTFSLLEVTPHTGRTHQIRIHLKYLGYPVVSDKFYGGRKTYRLDLKFCPRLFLHAYYLQFTHPMNFKKVELESKLPSDLQQVLDYLNHHE